MCNKEVTVNNKVGLHARPATFFIQKANEYKSSIWVEKDDRRVNAKSLLGVLSLGIVGGATIKVIADGSDEQDAVDGLVALVESGFDEPYGFSSSPYLRYKIKKEPILGVVPVRIQRQFYSPYGELYCFAVIFG